MRRLAILAAAGTLAWTGCCKSGSSLNSDDSTPQLSPSPLDFGTILTGTALTKNLDLHNAGGFTLQATDATLTAAQNGDNSFSAAPVLGQEVTPGGDFQWAITFAPAQDGVHQASLVLKTNSSATPTVTVQLTGLSYSYRVSVAPTVLDFGEVQVGTTSAPQSFTVTNDSTVSEALALGPLPSDAGFAVTPGEPSAQLSAGEVVTFQAVFAPTAPGPVQVSYPVVPCPTCSPTPVTFSGVGVDTELVATPASVAFGNVPEGVGVSQPVTIQAVSLPTGSKTALAAALAAPVLGSGSSPDGGDGFALAESGSPLPRPAELLPPAAVQLTVT